MRIRWTASALADLVRLHEYLNPKAPEAAHRVIEQLQHAVMTLRGHPLMGERLDAYAPRAVRKIVVGSYELRYEVTSDYLTVLRIWHGRENRRPGPPDDLID